MNGEMNENFMVGILTFIKFNINMWLETPIISGILFVYIFGVIWNILTNQRSFLLSLIWFIPIRFIKHEVQDK